MKEIRTFSRPGVGGVGEENMRRSGRTRRPTKKFEESWYSGDLGNLSSALGVAA